MIKIGILHVILWHIESIEESIYLIFLFWLFKTRTEHSELNIELQKQVK